MTDNFYGISFDMSADTIRDLQDMVDKMESILGDMTIVGGYSLKPSPLRIYEAVDGTRTVPVFSFSCGPMKPEEIIVMKERLALDMSETTYQLWKTSIDLIHAAGAESLLQSNAIMPHIYRFQRYLTKMSSVYECQPGILSLSHRLSSDTGMFQLDIDDTRVYYKRNSSTQSTFRTTKTCDKRWCGELDASYVVLHRVGHKDSFASAVVDKNTMFNLTGKQIAFLLLCFLFLFYFPQVLCPVNQPIS